MAVAQHDVAARIVGYVRVVGDEDDGASLGMEFLEEHENLKRCARVQVSGGLVCEYYRRVVHQCAGYCHTLHLSSRHLVGLVVEAVAQSDGLKSVHCALVAFGCAHFAVIHERQLHVFHTRGLRQKIVVLEDESDFAVAQYRPLRFCHGANGHSVEKILAT